MPQDPTVSPSHSASNFAGLLASLAARTQDSAAWNDAALADDVAVLSYESALRAQAAPSPSAADPNDPLCAAGSGEAHSDSPGLPDSPVRSGKTPPGGPYKAGNSLESARKCSSITIRMTEAECAQLRRRAAEAGMTISAYLRSCTFEVESLRAQVKATLAQLRLANSAAEMPPAHHPSPAAKEHWWARLWPHAAAGKAAVGSAGCERPVSIPPRAPGTSDTRFPAG